MKNNVVEIQARADTISPQIHFDLMFDEANNFKVDQTTSLIVLQVPEIVRINYSVLNDFAS